MVMVKAVAIITGNTNVKGSLQFVQDSNGATHVKGRIRGLSPGLHGFHIHALGDTTNGCNSTGPHFNPLKKNHGAPTDEERHAGDLGNVVAGPDGVAEVSIKDMKIPLSGQHSILGRAVVVHADPDDLGRGGHELSKTTGNAGARVGCGRIKINTDGSCLSAQGYASFGGLARNDQGMWIEGFCGRIGMAAVLTAELWGIRHGLKLAHDRGWVNVDIETDSYNANELVNGEEPVDNHPDRALIEDCRKLLKEKSFNLNHTLREGNKCADTLARYGGLQREREVRILIPPNEVVEDMMADLQGTMFPRGS